MFPCEGPELFMVSLFLIPLFIINHPLLVFCPSWRLTVFPEHQQTATNKTVLPAGCPSPHHPGRGSPGGGWKGRTLGIIFRRSAVRTTKGFFRNRKANMEAFGNRTLSSRTNEALPSERAEQATYHVQPCLLDMECFSMMAVRRSREKRWSRFSWPAVWLLMWGDAVDGWGWCESWKLFHRSRLYQKDRQRRSHKVAMVPGNTGGY